MKKKCALCFRGKCLDTNLNSKTNNIEYIDYKKCIQSIFKNIVYYNSDIHFDIYLHGWIEDLSFITDIVNDYKPNKYILEKQKNFIDDFKDIENYSDILKERYKHIHNGKLINYNLHFQNYFQNIFSYSYSISKVIQLIPEDIDYDYIIHLRYDLYIKDIVNLNEVKEQVYTDSVGLNTQSPLFYGDNLYCSSRKNTIFMKDFYTFLKNEIFNNYEYKKWVKDIINNKEKNTTGRYDHGIYSNQMIYAYFITKNNISYQNVISKVHCKITKT